MNFGNDKVCVTPFLCIIVGKILISIPFGVLVIESWGNSTSEVVLCVVSHRSREWLEL